MRPSATETVETPRPMPKAFQTGRGPPFGQVLSSRVSLEMPSRFGPRHCGQSPGAEAAKAAKDRRKPEPIRRAVNNRRGNFIKAASMFPKRPVECKQNGLKSLVPSLPFVHLVLLVLPPISYRLYRMKTKTNSKRAPKTLSAPVFIRPAARSDLAAIIAGIDAEQAASVALHNRFHFQKVGHFR